MLKNKKLALFLLFFLVFAAAAYATDDQYKPYLHKPSVPEHPKAKLYGKYQTNLFPGAATYTYPIEVPKGTNNLQPSISISYNSQSVKQRPSVLGAGWSFTQNYIYRDINFTPSNTTDDEFKLILNGASYNLIFDSNDGLYHTETETFSRIQNLSNAPNSFSAYWLVTLKDGTQLRFGYNPDSELASNVGYGYALKWSMDLIQDTHNNKIFYSYTENPYPQDNGSVYISQILYNNDQKRRIDFAYENSNRPDVRSVYEQGNKLEESRRLSDIYIFFNSTLVRRYNFEFISLNNESSLSSLHKLRHIGSDNASVLHNLTFGYYQSSSYYTNSTSYNLSTVFSDQNSDFGVRLADLNNDGYIDIIKGRGSTSEKGAWLNNKSGWSQYSGFFPPVDFVVVNNPVSDLDNGLRIADLNNDGLPDLIQGYISTHRAWLNNGSNWTEDTNIWPDPSGAEFINTNYPQNVDQGVNLVDFNGDGRVDLLGGSDQNPTKVAYMNIGSGWKNVLSSWAPPINFVKNLGEDWGARLADVNGDGLVDIIQAYDFGSITKKAWLNNGSGWVTSDAWIPPTVFTSTAKPDNGARLVDINGDGLVDIVEDFANGSSTSRGAWINTGNGWSNSTIWISPEPFTSNGKNIGRRIADADGDGFGDIIIGYNDGSQDIKRVVLRNSTFPYLLENITNEFGGVTHVSYSKSTIYNNTGDDGISDIGFNVWVVSNVTQDNSLPSDFNVLSNTSYYYFGGLYSYNDSEFRGFSIVNETLADKSVTSHYFHQNKQLKGKEFKTETYDAAGNIFSKVENNYNFTTTNSSYFVANLLSTAAYTYDGQSNNPKATNVSYRYDNYGNILSKTSFGDVSVQGDEKYENYTYSVNTSSWILDKPSWYFLLDSSYNKIRETKYSYDNHEYDSPPSKGDLTKVENWLDTGGGNPTTRFRYDDFGNLIEQTDALGRSTKYEYGLTDITDTYPERITNALGHATTYAYDIFGNILAETKNGIIKYNQYDTFGRITKEILPYDDSDFPTKKYEYNFDGIAPEIIKISQRTTSNNTINAFYIYDGFANLVQIKTPADYGQQVVKNLFYDGLFRVKEEQNPYFYNYSTNITIISNDTLPANKTRYNYDAVGRITSVINPDGTTKNTTFNKWEINDFDENNNRHTYLLDSYGRIISVTEYNKDFYLLDNLTFNTTYSYDGADELVGIRDTYGNNFNFLYDSLGRKVKLSDPDLGTWSYGYDLINNLIKQTDNKGNQIYLGYDDLNRIKQKNTTSIKYNFTYDIQYQSTLSRIEIGNITYSYTYDERLRSIKETRASQKKDWNLSMEKAFDYDSMNRIRQITEPNGKDIDIYYNAQNKINKIKGWINQSQNNPVGNPLNRTYNIQKTTQFDYYSDNIRLKQIKTDTAQILNYSYDNVGNIVQINDQANNRLYSMSYDNLDRLTNVTIGAYNWVYNYDAIGNILKIIRNQSTTTSFKFDSSLVHAPQKYIVTNTSADVYRQNNLNTSSRTKIIEFYLINEKNALIVNVNWSGEFEDNNFIFANIPFNLSKNENALVIVEHNYTKGGNYKANITAITNGSLSDYESLKIVFGAIANSLGILNKNASTIVSEFNAKNTISQLSVNWSWNCSNGIQSSVPFNMSANENLMVIMEHNYSLSNPNLSCAVYSSDGNQSKFSTIIFNGIKIGNYNSTFEDLDSVLIKFNIRNYFSTQNVNWNISSGSSFYNGSVLLDQLQSSTITQEINFSYGGKKQITVNIGAGNFTDSYTEYYKIKWLDLNQFYSTIKNATTRIFDFLITNKNTINTSSLFNVSNPALNYTTNLSNNESLIVVIEEDYPQGNKEINIKIFNQTLQEENLIEVFKIRQIQINELQTLYENDKTSVVSSIVKNNIKPLNLSWKLDNTESVINSTQNLELNTSQQAIVVIESNFSNPGFYSLNFQINSSTYNDNTTGVAVT